MDTPPTATTINNNDEPSETFVFRKLFTLARSPVWIERLAKYGTENQLNFAVMNFANLSVIQAFYEDDPSRLTSDTLCLACHYGARPGVISYLAKQKPELVKLHWDEMSNYCRRRRLDEIPHSYPISLAMRKGPGLLRPTEEDVLQLLEPWPDSVTETMKFLRSDNWPRFPFDSESTPLLICFHVGYTQGLLNHMIARIPESLKGFRVQIPCRFRFRDMQWIDKIITKTRRYLFFSGPMWEEPAFLHFLHSLFSKGRHIESLTLTLPREFVDPQPHIPESSTLIDPRSLPTLNDIREVALQCSSITYVGLSVADLLESHDSYLEFLLSSLENLPCLESLSIEKNCYQELPTEPLTNMLTRGILRRLQIHTSPFSRMARKRKRSPEQDFLLLALLPPITQTNNLVKLEVHGMLNVEYDAFAEDIVDFLKQNTTLEEVSINHNIVRSTEDEPLIYHDAFTEEETVMIAHRKAKIDYFVDLNRCGRGKARDPSSDKFDLVWLLSHVHFQLRFWERSGRDDDLIAAVTKVQYALLHEGIDKWAGS